MVLLGLIILFSCGADQQGGDIAAIDPNFFNLAEFVEQEKQRMIDMSISKTVSVNGIEETKELTKVDWELELAPFAQSNIDRPAMWDAYEVDTSSCQGMTKVVYLSVDSSSFTRSLEVTYRDREEPLDSVYAVLINNGFDSYIANTSQRLVWWEEGGYEINSIQQAMLSEERLLNIKLKWSSTEPGPCVKNSYFKPSLNH